MDVSDHTAPAPAAPLPRLRRPLSLLGLSFACILLAVIGAAAYAGYRTGMAQREEQMRATQVNELRRQFALGVDDLAAGRYDLAVTRFEYILSLDPAYPDAAAQLEAARAALRATPTPRPAPTTPVSTDAADIFALAQQYFAAKDWNGVITQLALLHSVDPDYEDVRADGMLYVALRNRGLERIQGDEMEAGIFDLDQAEAFGPLDAEAVNFRAWARLYLAAQSYWGVNWMQAAQILRQLYVLAPNFRDTASKLYQATLNYAGQLAAVGDYCAAGEQYAAAQALFADPNVVEAQATAQAACLLTPTPDLTAVPTPDDDPTQTPGPAP